MLWVLKSLVVICWWCCNLGVFGKVNLSFARERAKISVGELGYACDPSGGEWEDMQAYGRSFPLEWIWVKHMRVKCLFLWGSTYLVYSIFKWKFLLSNCKLFKNACSWYVMSFEELGCYLLMELQPWCFWESEFGFCPRTSKS